MLSRQAQRSVAVEEFRYTAQANFSNNFAEFSIFVLFFTVLYW